MTDEEKTETPLKLQSIDKGPEKLFCPVCGNVQYKLPDCEQCGSAIYPKKSYKAYWLGLILLFIIVIATLFLLKDQQGNPIISLDDNNKPVFHKPDWSKTAKQAERLLDEGKRLSSDEVKVHKWQDEEGVWHYSQKAPDGGEQSEVLSIDLDTNVLPHHKQKPEPK